MTLAEQGACAAQIGKPSPSQIERTRTGAQRSVLVLASSIVVAFLAAANAPSPLYARYDTARHASPLIRADRYAVHDASEARVEAAWRSVGRRERT